MSEPILSCIDVVKNYDHVKVLKGISCQFKGGEHYVIRGASGSGKSTLLHLLGGLDTTTGGKVLWRGIDYAAMNDDQRAIVRNQEIGFIFQFHYLLPTMTIEENIFLPHKIAGREKKGLERKEIKMLAERLEVAHLFKRYPGELSGGERQRVNLLRAVSMRPNLLLCDEPTGSLDSTNSSVVTDMLHDMANRFGATLIVVTHSDEVAKSFKNQVVIKDGMLL